MNKKYRHVDGFSDNTDYVLVEGGEHVHGIRRDGSKFPMPDYSPDDVERYVANGVWEEVQ